MTLDEYQQLATRTINTKLSSDERLLDASAGLAEEAGEILGLVRKHVYQSKALSEQDLEKELGDALWCLAIAANTAGLSLDRVAATNVAKLRKRYPNGYRDVR
jgi:NTP pyrophosphatase (non-canonical NTP hydrolase)